MKLLLILCAAALARTSSVETVGGLLRSIPAQFREPVGLFLNHSIDAATLRSRLNNRLSAPSAQPADISPAYVETLAGPFIRKAAGDSAQDLYETAVAYAELNAVLSGFLSESERAPVKKAASESRRRLSKTRQARVDAVLRALPDRTAVEVAPRDFVIGGPLVADVLEIELPFLRDALSRLRLEQSGAIALDAAGFPEAEAYAAAAKAAALLADQTLAAFLPPAGLALLERWNDIYRKTASELLTAGNELARVVYAEPTPGGRDMSILDYVRSERFKTPKWWVWSSQHTAQARQGFAQITAETAQSPFLRQLGPGAYSTIYWAALPEDEFGSPDPLGLRLRVNADGLGQERTLEVLAPVGREADGQLRWKGFFFKKIGYEWVPGSPRRSDASHRCIQCHYRVDAEGVRRLTPLPAQLKTKADFIKVGYKETRLLERYLAMVENAPRL